MRSPTVYAEIIAYMHHGRTMFDEIDDRKRRETGHEAVPRPRPAYFVMGALIEVVIYKERLLRRPI